MDYERYLNHIDQPVLVVDRLMQVTLCNAAFEKLFPKVRVAEHIRAYAAQYPTLTELLNAKSARFTVTYLERIYLAHVSFVFQRKTPALRCIVLSDITEAVRLEQTAATNNAQLEASNALIERQNAEIQTHIQKETESSANRETAMVLRDLHDTLGHTLTVLNALQKLALRALPNIETSRTELREALRLTHISMAELASIEGYQEGLLFDLLRRYKGAMERVGLEIELDLHGEELPVHRYMRVHLVRICQEAAANSIRHGGATKLFIHFRLGAEDISLVLRDNGRSTKPFRKGNGLIGMEERVNDLFGDITMGKTEDGGFRIAIDAPVILDEEEDDALA